MIFICDFPQNFDEQFINYYENINIIHFDKTFVEKPFYQDEQKINENLFENIKYDLKCIKGFMSSILRNYFSPRRNKFNVLPLILQKYMKTFPIMQFHYFLNRHLKYMPDYELDFEDICKEFDLIIKPYNLKENDKININQYLRDYIFFYKSKFDITKKYQYICENQMTIRFKNLYLDMSDKTYLTYSNVIL